MTKKTAFQKNRDEIIWNLINSFLVGLISFLSALSVSGEINLRVCLVGTVAFATTAVIKFAEYWKSQEPEYSSKILSII